MTEDYLRYYNLEAYLFEDVHRRFHEMKTLDAFDLFSIIIWKANRAKSKIGRRLSKSRDLDTAAREFAAALWNANSAQSRLKITMDEPWRFYLPMATAILSVLWPNEFTVYDIRVCDELKSSHDLDFSSLGSMPANAVWERYCEYSEAVRNAAPEPRALRDKDRLLWARSAAKQLRNDIRRGFQPSKIGSGGLE